jgi:hypothetical protein
MIKYWGYEPQKLLKTPIIGFLIALPFLLISLHIHFSNTRFVSSFVSWMRMTKSKHVFDYLLGKSAFFNSICLSFLVIVLMYFIFYREYKSGSITMILFSKGVPKNIFKEKGIFFIFLILAYVLFYFLLILGYGYYFISEYTGMLAGQLNFLPVFFLKYIVVYLIFTARTLFFTIIYFKYFKANQTSLAIVIALHMFLFFYPFLPLNWFYSVDISYEYFVIPALIFLAAFYLLNAKLNED